MADKPKKKAKSAVVHKRKKDDAEQNSDEKCDVSEKEQISLSLDVEKQKEFEEKVKQIPEKRGDEMAAGVIYLGHIPHGFFEDEIRGFFGQFGTVTRIRLSRSKQTGNSKGYAFIEFACEDVAKIAAETMDKYMMFGRLLKCHFVPQDKIHPRLWKGANKRFRMIPRNKNSIKEHNKERTEEQHQVQVKRLLNREKRKRAKLAASGIDYEFPGYVAEVGASIPKHTKFEDN